MMLLFTTTCPFWSAGGFSCAMQSWRKFVRPRSDGVTCLAKIRFSVGVDAITVLIGASPLQRDDSSPVHVLRAIKAFQLWAKLLIKRINRSSSLSLNGTLSSTPRWARLEQKHLSGLCWLQLKFLKDNRDKYQSGISGHCLYVINVNHSMKLTGG